MTAWGTPIERERRTRIRVAVAAYAYEIENTSIMSDGDYDALCLEVSPMRATGHAVVDAFFRKHFNPSTGMWVRQHPELAGIARIYDQHWRRP